MPDDEASLATLIVCSVMLTAVTVWGNPAIVEHWWGWCVDVPVVFWLWFGTAAFVTFLVKPAVDRVEEWWDDRAHRRAMRRAG